MRKKLIELLKVCECCDGNSCLNDCAKDRADHLLNNGVTIPKWISVEEWLPEKEECVLCYSNKHGGYMFVGYRGHLSGEWVEGYSLHIKDITHWMPLPEAPKEGE